MKLSQMRAMAQRRAALPQRELHRILSQAFERIRPLQCRTCSVPPPVFIAPGSHDAANWTIPLAVGCEHNCASFVRWLSVQYGRQYDLVEGD